MKNLVIGIAEGLVALPFRLARPFGYYWGRIWNGGRAAAKLRGLDPSVQFDGRIVVVGTGDVTIGPRSRIGDLAEFTTNGAGKIRIGREVRLNRGATVCADERVTIGDGSLVGEFTSIRDANHGIALGVPIREQPLEARAIHLGCDVWVGRGVCILPGVTLGDGCVVGANSVVTKDVPPNAIAAGIPARVLRQR